MNDADPRAAAVRALESELGHLFQQVRHVMAASAERFSPGMLPGTYKVFTTIVRQEQTTLSRLAETLLADKGQMSRAVRELEGLGFVSRTPDPDDGRSSILAPTPLGLERLDVARAPHDGALSRLLADWPLDDVHQLTRLLHAMTAETRRDE